MADFAIGIAVKQFLGKAKSELSSFAGQATQTIGKIGAALSNAAGTAALASFAGLSLALAGSAVAAVKFENEFANVKKTMSDVEDPKVFEKIQNDLVKLSTQIPIFASELASIATVGGQLGIGAGDITQFTEVVAKLGGATNMSAEEAATGMARFLAVTNEEISTIGKYASVLVELGNNTAATEGEILLLAQNFGATGEITGLATEEILAFSAAMRETGQQSQAGATALGKLFLNLSDAAKIGGKEMAVFAQTAGMDINEFRRLIETDIGSAAQIFLSGLNKMNAEGRSTTQTLDDLGLGTIRVQRALLSLANNEEGLAEARQRANAEAITQNALNEEAAEKFDTVAMRLQQFKSTMGAAAITLGQTLMPLLKALAGLLVKVADAMYGLAQLFADMPAVLWTLMAALGALSGLYLVKLGAEASATLNILKKLLVFMTTTGAILTVLAAALIAVGSAYKKYKDDMKNVAEVQDVVNDSLENLNMTLGQGFKAKPIDEATWDEFLTNLPEATRQALLKGVEQGLLGPETFDALVALGPELSEEVIQAFENASLETGFLGGAEAKNLSILIAELEGMELPPALDGVMEIIKDLQKASSEQGFFDQFMTDEDLEEKRTQLDAIFSIITGARDREASVMAQIRTDLEEILGAEGFRNVYVQQQLSTTEGTLSLLEQMVDKYPELNKYIKGSVGEAEALGEEFEAVESNLDSLIRIVNDFRTQIDNLFAPTEAQFKAGMNERELAKAHQEHADLHQEQKDLQQEDLDLQKEQIDLSNADLRTQEERLEMQELENEALEIEKKIREGMALSANDQLRKEKLKKELARVNAAAAQGSLEFADLEKQAIQEQIDAIDGKALTQKDADEKRKKAAEILATAEERRLDRLADIDERRLEIQERLAEIPDEIYAKHYDIHKLQKDGINAQLDMIEAQSKFNTLKETELRMTAELLGLNMAMIDGQMTLMNHARVESGPLGQSYLDKVLANLPILQALLGYTPTNSATGAQQTDLFTDWKASGSWANMKPTYKHAGGAFKGGKNYIVGEYGPERLKAFPGGGGMITSMGYGPNSGSGQTINHVTLNVTGLPSDPIAARRTAQLIQKELNKLKSDGRSGLIR